ncbi:MAG: cysteine desulfurase/selenocysteine lyase [Polyangiales bacterium]|jgi:cysteine desulfurase/selenocysteine lyase
MAVRSIDAPAPSRPSLASLFPAIAGRTYLDAAATSLLPSPVVAVVAEELSRGGGAGRSVHALGQRATDAYAEARREVAAHLRAESDALVWTRSATEGLNLVAGWGHRHLEPGDEVCVSRLEHHSQLLPWRRACEATGARLVTLECTPSGELDLSDVRQKLSSRTKVVALTHVSNVTGAVSPLSEVRALIDAASTDALFVVDGAQGVPHLDVDVNDIGCDAYVFSAHKTYGPPGVGALWLSRRRQEECAPLLVGGGMVTQVGESDLTFAHGPHRFEAGTPNVAGAVGTAAGLRFLAAHRTEERALATFAAEALESEEGVVLVGRPKARAGVVSFALEGIHPHDFGTFADDAGVALRVGHHCAQPLVQALGYQSVVRASFGVYNTKDDVTRLVSVVQDARQVFGP